ncbi:MAG: alpha/beta hydrolase [Pseudomonadota bacterium]|nr:alpha/beta hydrolase [Pseudomonadota bacterium]
MRLVAEASQGGGDTFEIARVCREIERGDALGWEKSWVDKAESTEGRAKKALTLGNSRTAMQYFFAANQYWRMADVFLTIERNADKAKYFKKCQENFRAAAALHAPPIEVITVQCGDEEYDGYFCHPRNSGSGKWPAIFFIGGADAFAEEIYFSGRELTERGYAMLLVDTPGRGSSMYLKNIPTRADYEVPGGACFDYLFARPEIDPDRVGLMGISMAGYYAPRVAAFETRIKALVSWAGCYSVLDDLYDFYEHLQPTVQRLLGGVTHEEARAQLKAFTMQGIAQNIKIPTLMTHGKNDRLMNWEGAKRLFDEIGSKDKELVLYDDPKVGGTVHCSHDCWAHQSPMIMDWIEQHV